MSKIISILSRRQLGGLCVLLLFLCISSCSHRADFSLVGESYAGEQQLEEILFIENDNLIYSWPCINDYNIPCLDKGKSSRHFMCKIEDDRDVQIIFTSFNVAYFPYKKLTISDSNNEIIAIDARGKTKIFKRQLEK